MAEAFDDFVTARGPRLLRFAYVLSGDRHLAEDLVQEVLTRMHGRWHRIEHVEAPEAYVCKAIVRQYLSWRRRRSFSEFVTDRVPEPAGGGDPGQRLAVRDELWRLLAGLPRSQRAVLVLRFYEDLDDGRIAEVLGCSKITVRVHASRGLARLRDALPSRGALPGRGTLPTPGETPAPDTFVPGRHQ